MISHEHRCIFIHIPRTAGTAIEHALVGKDWWFVNPFTKHLTTRQAQRLYGRKRWERYFCFAFVRNPWDKLVSMWECGLYRRQRAALRTFPAFVRHVHRNPFEQRTLHYHRILGLTPDRQLSRRDLRLRDRWGPAHADFVGRFESLEADMEHVFAAIGMSSTRLPVRNRSRQRRDYREYYDDETRSIVAERFALDIQLFGYEF